VRAPIESLSQAHSTKIGLSRSSYSFIAPRKAKVPLIGVFAIRDEHLLPEHLPELPASWQPIFAEFAKENALDISLPEAFQIVHAFYSQVQERRHFDAM
jgi:hypothetical protein